MTEEQMTEREATLVARIKELVHGDRMFQTQRGAAFGIAEPSLRKFQIACQS
jgi:hypothetical protein